MASRLEKYRLKRRAQGQLETLSKLRTRYRHLPPLPPPLPFPAYACHKEQNDLRNFAAGKEKTLHARDDDSQAFYKACAEGAIDRVHHFMSTRRQHEDWSTAAPDLAFALEEASHGFQVDVVKLLLQQKNVALHYRCFRRCNHHPKDLYIHDHDVPARVSSQSIFTSGRPELLDLLKVFHKYGGWHPNQLLGPLQNGKGPPFHQPVQEVALHYPRCLQDVDILCFLLSVGADPTIARERHCEEWFENHNSPVTRLSGDILQLAINFGSAESVDMLIGHGARLDLAPSLHSLARRSTGTPAEQYTKRLPKTMNVSKRTPDAAYPTLSNRFEMAEHLLSRGEDIDGVRNVYQIVAQYSQFPLPGTFRATPFSHAKGCRDWMFARWLLQHGAKSSTSVSPDRGQYPYVYGIPHSNETSIRELESS